MEAWGQFVCIDQIFECSHMFILSYICGISVSSLVALLCMCACLYVRMYVYLWALVTPCWYASAVYMHRRCVLYMRYYNAGILGLCVNYRNLAYMLFKKQYLRSRQQIHTHFPLSFPIMTRTIQVVSLSLSLPYVVLFLNIFLTFLSLSLRILRFPLPLLLLFI